MHGELIYPILLLVSTSEDLAGQSVLIVVLIFQSLLNMSEQSI